MASAVKPRTARKPAPLTAEAVTAPPVPSVSATVPTKQSQLIGLLQRDGGASIADLASALGWLPHTTRAALTGLRKKGHDVLKAKVDDVTRYSIAATDAVV